MKPIFKPFAAIEHPVRYFLLLFIIFFGGWHLADDLTLIFGNSGHTPVDIVFTLAFLSAVLTFGSRYIDQRKIKRQADERGTSSPTFD